MDHCHCGLIVRYYQGAASSEEIVAYIDTEGMLQRRTLKPTDFVKKVSMPYARRRRISVCTSSMEIVFQHGF